MELIENYLVFCMLGEVKSDKEKLCFQNQWMKCYTLLDDFLTDCGTKTISSDQTFCKIKSIKDKNYPKTMHMPIAITEKIHGTEHINVLI